MISIQEKILLVLLPFWSPLIPPMGISCLKSFLLKHRCEVKCADFNIVEPLRELYDYYFDTLRGYVPKNKQGNLYSIGQDVLRNHLMAHINHVDENENEYSELVKVILYKTFYFEIGNELVDRLNKIVLEFYIRLGQYFIELLEREKPAVLGLSVFNGTLPASIFVARLTRDKYPNIKIYMGGGVFADQMAMGTPNLDFFLEKTVGYIDKIFIGEGEILLLKLLRGDLPGGQRVYRANDIDWEMLAINSVNIPDFSDFDTRLYPYLGAYSSRSCPFQCSFCSETIQWGPYRKKSSEQIVKELFELYQKYNYQLFFMSDSLLNPVITDIAEEFLKNSQSIYWDACIRIDRNACDPRRTILWRRGGFYRARIGIESGSQRLLNLMDKRIYVEEIKEALASLAFAGIKTSTLWIVGHPEETEEDFQQTLDLIEELKDFIYDVEGTPFWYHLDGQVNSSQWLKQYKRALLYPENAREMLISQTWIVDCEPHREEIYRRLNRLVKHLHRLGIPNPYTMQEILQADMRWQKLHKNAVPTLLEFKDNYIDENKRVKEFEFGRNTIQKDANFSF